MKLTAGPALLRQLLTGVLLSPALTLAQGVDAATCTNLVTVDHPGTEVIHSEVVAAGQFAPEEEGFLSKEGLEELPSFCRLMGELDPGSFRFEIWIQLDGWNGQQVIQHGCCSRHLLARFSEGAAFVSTFTVNAQSAYMDGGSRHMREILGLLANIRDTLVAPQ